MKAKFLRTDMPSSNYLKCGTEFYFFDGADQDSVECITQRLERERGPRWWADKNLCIWEPHPDFRGIRRIGEKDG
jgi:hypothetical protein